MQKVSEEYKQSMKSALREQGYIRLVVEIINQDAQKTANLSYPYEPYCKDTAETGKVFKDYTPHIYASLEENFAKVDGSMFFKYPDDSPSVVYEDIWTGLVSNTLVSEGQIEANLFVGLNGAQTIRGLTIDFGDNCPEDFDIVCDDNTYSFRDNEQKRFSTDIVFENATNINLIIYKMKNPQNRFRVYNVYLGQIVEYNNDMVIDSSLENYISPICADLPQVDFSIQLKNYNHIFNYDNPKSVVNFFETGQDIQIYYGYQLPDGRTIEWLPGVYLDCSDWEVDDNTFTLYATDIIRNLDDEISNIPFYSDSTKGESYYALAVRLLDYWKIPAYYIDPALSSIYTKNPLPKLSRKELLQLIANACCCTLSQMRDGTISIRRSTMPDVVASVITGTEEYYSKVANILTDDLKVEYGTLALNYTQIDGTMYFVPDETASTFLNTGYVSNEISNEEGVLPNTPTVTLKLSYAHSCHGVQLRFASILPTDFTIKTYLNDELVDTLDVTDDITTNTVIWHEFDDFDTMVISFGGTNKPYNRIALNYVALNDVCDFKIERQDMTSSPRTIKRNQTKEIVVPFYTYKCSDTSETVVEETVTITNPLLNSVQYEFDETYWDYELPEETSSQGIRIVTKGPHWVFLYTPSAVGDYQIKVNAWKAVKTATNVTTPISNEGETVTWENPMIGDVVRAGEVGSWLADYYKSNIEYEYDTRGNPELDANDVIYQENEYVDDMTVTAYQVNLNFNGSFSGSLVTRRKEV